MMRCFDEEDRRLIQSTWYLPDLIERLREYSPCYAYYRGNRLTSDMTEEQIYAITYGSKEAFNKKYPNGYSQESLETAKDDLLYAFMSATSPNVAKEHLDLIKAGEECCVDRDIGEYILALAHGAPCKDIYSLVTDMCDSVGLSMMIRTIVNWSLRGDEFLNYFKEVDPILYRIYFPEKNTTDNKEGNKTNKKINMDIE